MLSSITTSPPIIAGMILAGGTSKRFNYKDKSWAKYGQDTLISSLIKSTITQVKPLSINTNSSQLTPFLHFDLPILRDEQFPQQGPLSGILRGLQWAKSLHINWLATFPVDTPNIPDNLVSKLSKYILTTDYQRIIACDKTHAQNVLGLWSTDLIDAIQQGLEKGDNKVAICLHNIPYKTVRFKHTFMNINTPESLANHHQ